MTVPPPSTEAIRAAAEEVLSHPDHTAGLETSRLVVDQVVAVGRSLARLTGHLDPPSADPTWELPNIAVRLDLPDGAERASRVYTIRRYVPKTAEVEIDLVVHPHDSPAMRWLADSPVGRSIGVLGPRAHRVPDPSAGPAVLYADASAAAAVHSILASWPAGAPLVAVLQGVEPAVVEDLPATAEVDLVEVEAVPGSLLADAAARLAPGSGTIWGGGERAEMLGIRDLARSLGRPAEQIQVMGYWKRGATHTDLDIARVLHIKTLLDAGLGFEDFDDLDS